jgi:enoyl-CoA hydratase/carnithine racemase
LSLEALTEIGDAFRQIGESDARVAVLRANGPAFSAGHDIGEMKGRPDAFYRELFAVCTATMETMQSIPQPVIARVHALATAAGCQLAASCDVVVASEEARFATPGVRIGLFCTTPMVALTRAVGSKRAMEMLLTGDPISAPEALQAGLVSRVVPAAELDAAVRAIAAKIVSSSREVIALGKRAFWKQLAMPQPLAYDYAQEVMAQNAAHRDAQEGFSAFLEKRPPKW